ncbi:MAG: Crp/Fnr family transcriptional regulator [Marinilabiliales bacterium]|nr:MAG: Crp/Fnr family transcriptional regulator [Marinilabiliales bacterium]
MSDNLTREDGSRICFFDLLDETQFEVLSQASLAVNYRAGELIFRQGTPVSHMFYLKKGLVKISKEVRNDRVIILDVFVSDSFIGLPSVFGEGPYEYSAIAVEDSEVVMTGVADLKDVISSNGLFAVRLLEQMSNEGFRMLTKFTNHLQKQLPGRVAEMLLFFSKEIFGSDVFDLPLSRRELADFTGTTKESMIRTLAEFRHDRIIKLDGKKVEIISHDIINALSRLG